MGGREGIDSYYKLDNPKQLQVTKFGTKYLSQAGEVLLKGEARYS